MKKAVKTDDLILGAKINNLLMSIDKKRVSSSENPSDFFNKYFHDLLSKALKVILSCYTVFKIVLFSFKLNILFASHLFYLLHNNSIIFYKDFREKKMPQTISNLLRRYNFIHRSFNQRKSCLF